MIINHKQIAEQDLATMTDQEMDNDWKLDEFFGSTVVINLTQAKDRLKQATEELQSVGSTQFEIFPAIDGQNDVKEAYWRKFKRNWANIDTSKDEGQAALERLHKAEAGCYMSHYKIIQKMKEGFDQSPNIKKFSSVLVLEDDNGFGIVNTTKTEASKTGVGRIFRKAMQELPDNWDMLYLLALPLEPFQPFSPHLAKAGEFLCTNAVAINAKMYGPILKLLSKIEDPTVSTVLPMDRSFSFLNKLFRCYAIHPSIAYQHMGTSAISQKHKPFLTQ